MYKRAREQAGLSQEEAAYRLHIGRRTLVNYENMHTIIPTEVVVKMAMVYEDPSLLKKHCSNNCPIGQIIAHEPKKKNIAAIVLGFLKEFEDVKNIKNKLIEITSDGRLDKDEMPDFMEVLNEVQELKQAIEEIEEVALSKVGIDIYKEKAQASA